MARRTGWQCRFVRALAVFVAHCAFAPANGQLPTTLDNFFQPGTQPDEFGDTLTPFIPASQNCQLCHEVYNPGGRDPIFGTWAGSMKANAVRDPLFQAALTIANQDAAFAGDLCIRCHSPVGWLEGRSLPTDGSALLPKDHEGVSCNFCHRMVDPVLDPGYPQPPQGDDIIRVALLDAGLLPIRAGGANYVVDPADSRRGPYPFLENGGPPNVPVNYHFPDTPPIIYSPFHSTSEFCATCHDVNNPAFTRQPDGSYALNPIGAEHPTGDSYDMFPIERTYSEWLNSEYATVGVDAKGVFGGNHPTGIMRTCQDCHMPDMQSYGSAFDNKPLYERPDVPSHEFSGGNTWIQDVLLNLYPFAVDPEYMYDSQDRALYMLQNAATLVLYKEDCDLRVRIINETGHKLPTGYPEGRRMWIEVAFLDPAFHPVAIRGHYDWMSADLTESDSKVYEAVLGVDEVMSQISGIPTGPSFHFALNNKFYKDNRIPPRGFTNAAFAAVGAAPVATNYADGQFWDDTAFRVPSGATSAVVTLYYQTASKEYITFLRDANKTDDKGDVLYEQWELTGKSPPVTMREQMVLELSAGLFGDADCNGEVDLFDHALLYDCLSGPANRLRLGCEAIDADLDGSTDLRDFAEFQLTYLAP